MAATETTVIRPIDSERDLDLVYRFDSDRYDRTGTVTWELFHAWWNAYPAGFTAAFTHDVPVAVMGLFPVTTGWADKVVRLETNENDLTGDIIRGSCRRAWYVSGISRRTGLIGLRPLAIKLICQSLQLWYLANRAITNEVRLVAVAATPKGEKLLRAFGFECVAAASDRYRDGVYEHKLGVEQLRNMLLKDSRLRTFCDEGLIRLMEGHGGEMSAM